MYRPVNKCIFCGVVASDLRREHIIPYSLGGTLVLPKATCGIHAELTSKFEQTVARDMYGIDRAIQDAPTRNRGTHQARLQKLIDTRGTKLDGQVVSLQVKQADMPRTLSWIEMPTPGLLRGIDPDIQDGLTYKVQYVGSMTGVDLKRRHSLASLEVVSSPMDHWAFVRTLAKTAHTFAAAEIGPDSFDPWLLPLILGEAVSATYLVGGFEPQARLLGPPLRLLESSGLLIVHVTFHAFPHLPSYQAIAGRRREA